ncbi:CPBP family intramembrane glutamic endopeptidase [Xylocopilactobacillus apis]|uniref:Protease n=1 Tax=Xylocopilactobacillus apis TaxID=2932183 RepID=A0AAU9D6M9_9LACO|nr:CPBP family intramembrane glutamic endopeptidase [Xylocopilactobacillus apis]BDR57070.1 protease [Xylocopilactobacillus apis]
MKTKSERNTGIIFSIGFGVILPQMILPLVESLKINLLTPLWYIFIVLFSIKTYSYCKQNEYIKISKRKIAFGFLLGIFLIGLEWIFLSIFPNTSGSTVNLHMLYLEFPLMCFLGPIWEEIIFRGILIEKIPGNSFVKILITSILFSLFHGYMSIVLLFYFIVGVFFGLANRNENDLSTSIIAHIVVNTVVVIINLII